MLTVRFATGLSLQYNSANHAVRSQYGYTDLYSKEPSRGGTWIAQVPNDCLIEVALLGPMAPACRVYNPFLPVRNSPKKQKRKR